MLASTVCASRDLQRPCTWGAGSGRGAKWVSHVNYSTGRANLGNFVMDSPPQQSPHCNDLIILSWQKRNKDPGLSRWQDCWSSESPRSVIVDLYYSHPTVRVSLTLNHTVHAQLRHSTSTIRSLISGGLDRPPRQPEEAKRGPTALSAKKQVAHLFVLPRRHRKTSHDPNQQHHKPVDLRTT